MYREDRSSPLVTAGIRTRTQHPLTHFQKLLRWDTSAVSSASEEEVQGFISRLA
jgi:hypothetical protein